MPYDPNYPVDGSLISAAEWRAVLAESQNQIVQLEARVAVLEAGGGGVTLAQVQAEVAAGVATCANNVDGFQPQGLGASDPPTQGELQSLMDNEAALIAALHR